MRLDLNNLRNLRLRIPSPRIPRRMLPLVTVITLDLALDDMGEHRTVTWLARVPQAGMRALNPGGYGWYQSIPIQKRRAAWIMAPLAVGILSFTGIFFLVLGMPGMDTSYSVQIAGIAALMLTAIIGLPFAFLLVKTAFRAERFYVVARLTAVQARDSAIAWPMSANGTVPNTMLYYITPPPMEALEGVDALAKESEEVMWRFEALSLGVDGRRTNEYLRAVGAERDRHERYNAKTPSPLSLDGRQPNPATPTHPTERN